MKKNLFYSSQIASKKTCLDCRTIKDIITANPMNCSKVGQPIGRPAGIGSILELSMSDYFEEEEHVVYDRRCYVNKKLTIKSRAILVEPLEPHLLSKGAFFKRKRKTLEIREKEFLHPHVSVNLPILNLINSTSQQVLAGTRV